jgi:hypothetical protein
MSKFTHCISCTHGVYPMLLGNILIMLTHDQARALVEHGRAAFLRSIDRRFYSVFPGPLSSGLFITTRHVV